MHARISGDLGVERDREGISVAHGDGMTVELREDLDALARAPPPTARG